MDAAPEHAGHRVGQFAFNAADVIGRWSDTRHQHLYLADRHTEDSMGIEAAYLVDLAATGFGVVALALFCYIVWGDW